MKYGARDRDRNDEQFRKLFIGGLNAQTDDAKLRQFYEQWGELTDCVVMKDKTSGRSRGFGFVTYKDQDSVERAMSARPHTIDEKVVEAKRAAPRESNNDPRTQATVKKMFIGGYKDDISEEDLRAYFGQYGEIKEISILSDPHAGKKRGFCFVTFEDYDPVDKACLERFHTINGHRLEAQKALTREQMAEIRQKQQAQGGGYQQGPGPHGGYGGPGGYGGYGGGWQGQPGGGYYGGGYGQPPYGNPYPAGGYGPPPGGWAPPPPAGAYAGAAGGYGAGPAVGYGGYQGGYGAQQGGYGGGHGAGGHQGSGYGGAEGGYGGQGGHGSGGFDGQSKQGGQDGGPTAAGGPAGGPGPGPMRGGSFTSRAAGPYGGGYGSSGRR